MSSGLSPSMAENRFSISSTPATRIIMNFTQSLISSLGNSTNSLYDDEQTSLSSLVRYRMLYRNYHGIISSFVCIFGLTCNLFNIIVLTRPLMRSSTNVILTSLALSDLLKMLFVLPAVIIFYCLPINELKSEPDSTSYFQVKFYMIQMLFTLTLHCISTWLTVFLAAFRYVFLSCKAQSASLSSSERTIIGVGVVVILSTILCIPSYIEHRIATVYVNHTSPITNITVTSKSYRFEETALSRLFSIREKVFILHSVIFKLIPCALLLLFSFLLVQQLRHALQKSELLHRHSSSVVAGSINSTRVRARRREKENRRTTLMLVIVCVLFLVTELPQGALLLLTFLSKTHSAYYFQIYQQLGDTFDILALINNSVNFILYCLMSRAFRDTFKQTFCFCQDLARRPSRISFAQQPLTVKSRARYLDPSAAYETVSTYKCADDYRTSTAPIIKSLSSDGSTKKKNRTRKALRFFQPATSIAT